MNQEQWIKQYKEMMEFYEKRIKHLEESLDTGVCNGVKSETNVHGGRSPRKS